MLMAFLSPALDAFAAAARLGSFTRAADRLSITQSALSQRILKLEAELKTTLFVRERGALRLTAAGESLLKFCQAQEGLENQFLYELKDPKNRALQGVYRIGTFSSIYRSLLIPATARRVRENPIRIQFLVREIADLPDLLRTSQADLILTDQRWDREGWEATFLGHEENVLVRSRRHDPDEEWFLDHDENDQTTLRYLQKFSPRKKSVRRRYLDDVHALVDGVKAGWGLAVLPRFLVAEERELEIIDPSRILKVPVWAHHHAQPFYTRLHEALLKDIVQTAKTVLSPLA